MVGESIGSLDKTEFVFCDKNSFSERWEICFVAVAVLVNIRGHDNPIEYIFATFTAVLSTEKFELRSNTVDF